MSPISLCLWWSRGNRAHQKQVSAVEESETFFCVRPVGKKLQSNTVEPSVFPLQLGVDRFLETPVLVPPLIVLKDMEHRIAKEIGNLDADIQVGAGEEHPSHHPFAAVAPNIALKPERVMDGVDLGTDVVFGDLRAGFPPAHPLYPNN